MTTVEVNSNGRRNWLSKETLVPWSAAFAFAGLAWWGANKFGELNMTISQNAATVAEKVAEQRRETSLELQALKINGEYMSARLDRIEKSVEALTRGAGK